MNSVGGDVIHQLPNGVAKEPHRSSRLPQSSQQNGSPLQLEQSTSTKTDVVKTGLKSLEAYKNMMDWYYGDREYDENEYGDDGVY